MFYLFFCSCKRDHVHVNIIIKCFQCLKSIRNIYDFNKIHNFSQFTLNSLMFFVKFVFEKRSNFIISRKISCNSFVESKFEFYSQCIKKTLKIMITTTIFLIEQKIRYSLKFILRSLMTFFFQIMYNHDMNIIRSHMFDLRKMFKLHDELTNLFINFAKHIRKYDIF